MHALLLCLFYEFFNFLVAIEYRLRKDFRVNLSSLNIGVAQHFRHDFNRDPRSEGDCRCKGMASDMGCDVFVDAGFLL